MTLTITDNSGAEILKTDIGDQNPHRVTVAVLNAINDLPKLRARRSDAGKPRVAGKGEGAGAQK